MNAGATSGVRQVGYVLWLPVAILLLAGCSVIDGLHGADTGTIIPALRYVEDRDGLTRYEDISGDSDVVRKENIEVPKASGAMVVDCHSVREIGVIVRHGYISRGSYVHDFDYRLSWPETDARELKHFTFEERLRGWFTKGAARFREPLKDGRVAFSVTHRKRAIYTTEFDVVGCQRGDSG